MMNVFQVVLLVLAAVHALPLRRDVYSPPITSPTSDTTWTIGAVETVTWSTADLPPDSQLTTPYGQVILGYLDSESAGEHLMFDEPLAEMFKLSDGQVNITVPSVKPRTSYIVVLLGDSGNISPTFTIRSDATSLSSLVSSATVSSATASSMPTSSPASSSHVAFSSSIAPTSSSSGPSVSISTKSIVSTTTASSASTTSTPGSSSSTESASSASAAAANQTGTGNGSLGKHPVSGLALLASAMLGFCFVI